MRHKNESKMQEIKSVIEQFLLEEQTTPTITQIAKRVHFSASTVHAYLVEMNNRGMITYGKRIMETDVSRMFSFSPNPTAILSEGVHCGDPQEQTAAIEEFVNLPETIFGKGESFILRAYGDSMEDADIFEGNLVVVKKNLTAKQGDIVVALDEDGRNTLKRLGKIDSKTGKATLEYMNEKVYKDKVIETRLNTIQGIAKYVIKEI